MKKRFEMPTIVKMNMSVSDKTMCASVTSGVTTDFGIITDMTMQQMDSMTTK